MPPNSARSRASGLRRCSVVLLGLYGLQLAIVATSFLWPAIDVEDAGRRYVVTRFNGPVSFLPAIGLVPEITGEPVWLIVTDEPTGTTTRRQYDLIRDVQFEHPVLANARFVRRMFD